MRIADGVRSPLSQTGARLHTHPLRRAAITLALLLAAVPVAASPSLPANFWFFNAVPGTQFDTPTTIAFMPDGRLLVGEKRGRVWMVKDGYRLPTPVWSSENEI